MSRRELAARIEASRATIAARMAAERMAAAHEGGYDPDDGEVTWEALEGLVLSLFRDFMVSYAARDRYEVGASLVNLGAVALVLAEGVVRWQIEGEDPEAVNKQLGRIDRGGAWLA